MQWCAQGRVTTESDPGADDIEWSGQLYVVESRLRASDVTNALNGDFSGFEAVISPPGEPARLVDPFVPVSRQCGAPCRGGTIQIGTTDHQTMYIKGLSAYIFGQHRITAGGVTHPLNTKANTPLYQLADPSASNYAHYIRDELGPDVGSDPIGVFIDWYGTKFFGGSQ